MEVLVVESSEGVLWGLPYLLVRAGFSVDWIGASPRMRLSRFIRSLCVRETFQQIVQVACDRICQQPKPYDWVIAGDDQCLKALSDFEWPDGATPRLLAAAPDGNVSHIYSKIGLSQTLRDAGVRIPPFEVAANCVEAVTAAHRLGYPVLLKVDSSAGGIGVRQCVCDDDVMGHEDLFSHGPLLVQKKIEGQELDLSAIFFERELVHFSYSRIEKTLSPFGLSVLRTYLPSPLVSNEVFTELAALGRALGANGFSNISCIDAADGSGRYYFEADLRPNVWADFSRFYGEDAAVRIRNWFVRRTTLTRENASTRRESAPILIPYFLRLEFRDLVMNRYKVWRFIPLADPLIVLSLLTPVFTLGVARALFPRKMRSANQAPGGGCRHQAGLGPGSASWP